jgi:hypothetical protein
MITSTQAFEGFGAHVGIGCASVTVNVHDRQHGGEPSATLSFNFGNGSIILHADEADMRELAQACGRAADEIAAMPQQVAA